MLSLVTLTMLFSQVPDGGTELRIFGADGGTVFTGANPASEQSIELRPGAYSLKLGDGPSRDFVLKEGDDATVEATNFKVKGVWPDGEEIPFFDYLPGLRTTRARRSVDARGAIGTVVRDHAASGLAFVIPITIGVTERLQWNFLLPYFSYLAGDAGVNEWILEGGADAWGFNGRGVWGHPVIAVAHRRYLRPEEAWLVGAEGSTTFFTPGRSFGQLGGRLQGGYSRTFARRVTVNVGASVSNFVRLPGTGFQYEFHRAPFRAPTLAVGAQLRAGGRDLPLVQVHITRRISVDLHSTGAIAAVGGHFRLYADVLFGLGYTLP